MDENLSMLRACILGLKRELEECKQEAAGVLQQRNELCEKSGDSGKKYATRLKAGIEKKPNRQVLICLDTLMSTQDRYSSCAAFQPLLLIEHVFYFCMFRILNRAVPKSRDSCSSTSRDSIENDEGCLPF